MYHSKLATPKEHRLEERNASRVLEEESDRLTHEFLHLFVGGSIGHRQEHRRSAKLANWDDDGDRKKANVDLNNSKKMTLPARYKFRRKRIATVESECVEDGPAVKSITTQSQNQPIFSISLLNPLMQEGSRGTRPSQKMRKIREKAASHLRSRFIQHLTLVTQGRAEPPLVKNHRVHSLNSQSTLPPSKQTEQRVVINFDNFSQGVTKKQWTPIESESRSMESILKRKKRVEEILEGRRNEKDLKQTAGVPASPNPKFKKSKQFQKLRMLLTLEKI